MCKVCGKQSEKHHILSRKSHPEYKDSEFNLLPLCRAHHVEIHLSRNSFIKKYKLENEMESRGFEYSMGKWLYNKG